MKKSIRFVRLVRTLRGAKAYYYFNATSATGERVQERLPDPDSADFAARYNDCLARSGIRNGVVKRHKAPHLYFIGVAGEVVKIGKSYDAAKRLATIQTGYPRRLSILCVAQHMGRAEGDYHRRFASTRLNGEWFDWSDEMASEIARLNANLPPVRLPAPPRNKA